MWVYDDSFTDPTVGVLLRSVKDKVKNEYDIYILRYTEVTITQRGCDVRVEKQICLQSFCVLYSYGTSLSLYAIREDYLIP